MVILGYTIPTLKVTEYLSLSEHGEDSKTTDL